MTQAELPIEGHDESHLPPSLARFRHKYRKEIVGPRYNGVAHLAFVYLGSFTVIGIAASLIESPISVGEWSVFVFTFFLANFIEYAGHRLPMHNRMLLGLMFHRHTNEHHQFFTEVHPTCRSTRDYKIVLFPPIMLFVYLGLNASPVAGILYLVYSTNAAMLYVIMAMLYFLQYESLHFCYHLHEDAWIARLPVIRRLREHHRVHHAHHLMNSYNFNITWPIADFVFGTIYRGEIEPAYKAGDGHQESQKRAAA